jgi:hypothetical protein
MQPFCLFGVYKEGQLRIGEMRLSKRPGAESKNPCLGGARRYTLLAGDALAVDQARSGCLGT